MAVRYKRIQDQVDRLLNRNEITGPPVDVEGIAKSMGIQVRRVSFQGESISGFIYRYQKKAIIGVNRDQSRVRQRFTIAHEIGHYLLHHKAGLEEVHVDHGVIVQLRSERSSKGTDVEEVEANAFAARLLMPADFLHEELYKMKPTDFEDDAIVQALARRYSVSSQALLFRLTGLGYIG